MAIRNLARLMPASNWTESDFWVTYSSTDGRLGNGNRGTGDEGWHDSASGGTHWIKLMFDKEYLVSSLKVYSVNRGTSYWPSSATVAVSSDGTNWTDVVTVNPNTYWNLTTTAEAAINFTPVKARYVRLTMVASGYLYLNEIEIYGDDAIVYSTDPILITTAPIDLSKRSGVSSVQITDSSTVDTTIIQKQEDMTLVASLSGGKVFSWVINKHAKKFEVKVYGSTKYLFKSGNDVYKYANGWYKIGTMPVTQQMFNDSGIYTLPSMSEIAKIDNIEALGQLDGDTTATSKKITVDYPNTEVLYLVTFDGVSYYSMINGSWFKSELSDIYKYGMTKSTVESINLDTWSEIFKNLYIRFAVCLKSNNPSSSPYVDNISVIVPDAFEVGDYLVVTDTGMQLDTLDWERVNSCQITQTTPQYDEVKKTLDFTNDLGCVLEVPNSLKFESGKILLAPTSEGSGSDPYVTALLHAEGVEGSTSFVDETGRPWVGVGTAKISTAQRKFGNSSLSVAGAACYIKPTGSPSDYSLGTSDFTIDWWELRTNHERYKTSFSLDTPDVSYVGILAGHYASGVMYLYMSSSSGWDISGGNVMDPSPPLNTWTHYAIVRSGNTFYTFKNGIQTCTFSSSGRVLDPTVGPSIGKYYSYQFNYPNYIDEFRISKGIARWTSAFTPPDAPYATKKYPIDKSYYLITPRIKNLDRLGVKGVAVTDSKPNVALVDVENTPEAIGNVGTGKVWGLTLDKRVLGLGVQ